MNDILLTLEGVAESCTIAERKVVDYILRYPEKTIHLNIIGLGKNSGASTNAVVRLCKRIKLRGFKELRPLIARAVYSNREKFIAAPESEDRIKFSHPAETATDQILRSQKLSLEDLRTLIRPDDITKAIRLIENGNRIFVYSRNKAEIVGLTLIQKLNILGFQPVHFSNGSDFQKVSSLHTDSGDVAVIISYSGMEEEILEMACNLKKNQTPVISFTKLGSSPLLDFSDITLTVPATESSSWKGLGLTRFNFLTLLEIFFQTFNSEGKYKQQLTKADKILNPVTKVFREKEEQVV